MKEEPLGDEPQPDGAPPPAPRKAMRNTIIAMISNFSTAYNLLTINVAHVIIANQYCSDTESDECVTAIDFASTSCLVGAIVGQLTFGYVGDCVGRSTALRLTMALSILGALLSAFSVPLGAQSSIFYVLGTARSTQKLADACARQSRNTRNIR